MKSGRYKLRLRLRTIFSDGTDSTLLNLAAGRCVKVDSLLPLGRPQFVEVDSFSISEDRVKRYLPHGRSGRLDAIVGELRSRLEELIQPRALFVFRKHYELDASDLSLPKPVNSCSRMALAVATIGKQIEEESDRLRGKGEISRGFLLDSLGAAAVTKLACMTGGEIAKRVSEAGLGTTRAFSPGSGSSKWGILNQQLIFDNLDASRIGVELTSSSTMIPKKSISFVLGVGSNYENRRPEELFSCRGCPRTNCDYRDLAERSSN